MNTNRTVYDITGFFKDTINRLTVIVLIFSCILTFGIYKTYKAVIKCERKIDFRYFNLTRSLEDIHNVKINTKDGSLIIIHQITANQLKL